MSTLCSHDCHVHEKVLKFKSVSQLIGWSASLLYIYTLHVYASKIIVMTSYVFRFLGRGGGRNRSAPLLLYETLVYMYIRWSFIIRQHWMLKWGVIHSKTLLCNDNITGMYSLWMIDTLGACHLSTIINCPYLGVCLPHYNPSIAKFRVWFVI